MEENKDEILITNEEAEAIAAKVGYSTSAVKSIIRGHVTRIQRHDQIFDIYEKVKHLRELHHENYMKDLENL